MSANRVTLCLFSSPAVVGSRAMPSKNEAEAVILAAKNPSRLGDTRLQWMV
jgi:hypothetical protein